MQDAPDSSTLIRMCYWAFTHIEQLHFVGSKHVEGLFLFSVLFGHGVPGPCFSISAFSGGGAKVGLMILSHVHCCWENIFVIINLINL